MPYAWVEDEPVAVGITSSTGIQTTEEIAAAVETQPSPGGFLGYAIIGALVGIVPVALGLLWLPSLRRAAPSGWPRSWPSPGGCWRSSPSRRSPRPSSCRPRSPAPWAAPGSSSSAWPRAISPSPSSRSGSEGARAGGTLGGLALALLVAIGIGVHNLGEGLAVGTSFALGELTLGTFLIVGFMLHNVTEGLGIAAPAAEGERAGFGRLAALVLIAGAPTILGAWIGGYVTSDVLAVLFFAVAAGALQVVVEVERYVARRAPGGLTSGYAVGGFLAGLGLMYATGLLVG